MTTCSVLRCGENGTAAFLLSPPDQAIIETIVCASHKAALDDGADWNWDPDGDLLLMGADAHPRLSEWGTEEGIDAWRGQTLCLDLRRDGVTVDIVRVWISSEDAIGLGEWLTALGRSKGAESA